MLVSSPAPLGVVTSPTGGGLLGLGGLSVYIYRGFVRLRDLYASSCNYSYTCCILTSSVLNWKLFVCGILLITAVHCTRVTRINQQ